MGLLKFLFKLLKKNKFKNFIISIQIAISVFAFTFLIVPIVKSIETNYLIDSMNLEKNIAFFEESMHIQLSPKNYTNEEYSKLINFINNMEGVEGIGSVYSLLPINQQLNILMYDKEVCNNIKLPLAEGNWFPKNVSLNDTVPVIITNNLQNKYPINSTFDLSLDGQENDKKEINIKCKVIGILKNKSYIYTGQFNHSTPSVSDLFSKTTTNDEIIIIPNLFDEIPRYWAYQGMLIKYNNFENISTQIKENGLGRLNNIDSLKENDTNNVFIYNEQKIYEFIIVFIFILISISGYNTLANLEYRRLLTIYYITGLTCNKGITLLTIRNLILVIVPTIISSIISNVIVCNVKTLYVFDIKNILITTILYLIIFIITTFITILNLRNQKPIEILREVD